MASRAARHRFDPVSLVLGAMAVTAGLIVLGGGSLLDDATVLFPAGLIALGVAILLQVGARRENRGDPSPSRPCRRGSPGRPSRAPSCTTCSSPIRRRSSWPSWPRGSARRLPPGGEHPAVETDPGPDRATPTRPGPTAAATESAADPTASEPSADQPDAAPGPDDPDRDVGS